MSNFEGKNKALIGDLRKLTAEKEKYLIRQSQQNSDLLVIVREDDSNFYLINDEGEKVELDEKLSFNGEYFELKILNPCLLAHLLCQCEKFNKVTIIEENAMLIRKKEQLESMKN